MLNLSEIPKRGKINTLTETWRPWRSLAVWYIWQKANDSEKNNTQSKTKPSFPVCNFADNRKGRFFLFSEHYLLFTNH